MRSDSRWVTGAVFAVLLALCAYSQRERLVPVVPDGSIPGGYVRMAHHTFESGTLSGAPVSEDMPPPEARREPLLPWLLAGLMVLDSDFAGEAARCVGQDPDDSCVHAYRNVPRMNLALHLGAALVAALTLLRLGVGRFWAGAGLLLVGMNASGARFVGEVRLESVAVLGAAVTSYCLMRFAQERTRSLAAASGIALGLVALTKAQFLYLIGPVLLGILLLGLAAGGKRRLLDACVCSLTCGLAFALVVGPWMIRNHHHFGGAFIVTPRRALPVLSARVHYDLMTPEEIRAAYLYWDFDGPLGVEAVLPLESYTRLARSNPDGYHAQSKLDYKRRYRQARDDGADALEAAAIVRAAYFEEIREAPWPHLRATIPITYRLLHGDSRWWLTFPATLLAVVLAAFGRRWEALFALAPCLYSLAFHGLMSHGKHRYGIPAVPGLAVGAAFALSWISDRVGGFVRRRIDSR